MVRVGYLNSKYLPSYIENIIEEQYENGFGKRNFEIIKSILGSSLAKIYLYDL